MYKTPGVYVEEISTFPSSVVPVSTAIPAFIGYTAFGGDENEESRPLDHKATRIQSLLEYEKLFGKAENQSLVVTLQENTPIEEHIPIEVTLGDTPSPYLMYYQVLMYFLNGGGPCYIISVGGYSGSIPISKAHLDASTSTSGLAIAKKEDEITLLAFPDAPALNDTDYYGLYQDALTQCAELKDRFTIIDVKEKSNIPSSVDGIRGTEDAPTAIGNTDLNYGAAYFPYLKTMLSYQYNSTALTGITFQVGGEDVDVNVNDLLSNTQFTAALERLIASYSVTLPPCGTIAGVYAQVDRTRGVFKAPANISLNSVIAPTVKISDQEQQDLNVHTSGKSINAIRSFAGKGVLVWGARTLEGNSNEWRYISVRRFFIFAEESIQKAIEPFVFEANNENTWIRIRGLIENFLTTQWRAGAIAGSTADQAFFVNIGLGETMTAQDILEGKLIVEIGMAVVRPAEFIILRFTHKVQES